MPALSATQDTAVFAPAARSARAQGAWLPGGTGAARSDADAWRAALHDLARPVWVVEQDGEAAVARGGQCVLDPDGAPPSNALPLLATVPALRPEALGDAAFRAAHGLRYAYVGGAMANGISGEDFVEALARAGMLGEFGAAGLSPRRVEAAIDRLQKNLGDIPFGMNLIHSPAEPALEAAIVDLYLRRGIRLVSASAYLQLTLPLVKYRTAGIHRDADGEVVAPHRVIAKVSRVEVARHFMAPPPEKMLAELVERGDLTHEQAGLAATIPMAEDLTAEADSGGHTDNRPALALLPGMLAFAERQRAEHHFARPLRVGLGGGIATPAAAAAAFAMGAAFVLTGSVNQACVESAACEHVKAQLAKAGQADVMMAPAADMFEMGVNVQVLKFGTMFPMRARKLYELYKACSGLDALPDDARAMLEKDYFRQPLAGAWEDVKAYFAQRDPAQIERGERDARHKMALVFRMYLGMSSKWAIEGEPTRRADYQIWCGPAMGAFNEWTRGSFLAEPGARRAVTVARNLLAGASVLARAASLRGQGVEMPAGLGHFAPMQDAALDAVMGS